MEPTLEVNDRVLVIKNTFIETEISTDDIVVFYGPEINFDEIFKDFRKFCFRPSDETFKKSYIPVLTHTKRLLTSKKKPVANSD